VKEAETAENSSFLEEGLAVLSSRSQSTSPEQQQAPAKIMVTKQALHFVSYAFSFCLSYLRDFFFGRDLFE
jgi:hypothetical protein